MKKYRLPENVRKLSRRISVFSCPIRATTDRVVTSVRVNFEQRAQSSDILVRLQPIVTQRETNNTCEGSYNVDIDTIAVPPPPAIK